MHLTLVYAAGLVLRLLFGFMLFVGAVAAETLTVATYNVENYGPADRMTDAGFRKDYPKPEAEKRALRAVIRGLNADVLVLQEMGAQPYLDELCRDLRAEGCDYPYAILAAASDDDRHTAVLSRRRFVDSATMANLEFLYFGKKERVKRGLLRFVVQGAGGEVTFFAVHLKSRFTDRLDDPESALRRTAEAAAIRDAILARFPDPTQARFVVLGDCNDTKGSKPLERLRHRGQTEIATLLPANDPRGEAWTYFYRKEDTYQRVDYVLVSPGLLPTVAGEMAAIYDGEGVGQASDHRPVFVRFEIGGQQ